MAEVEVAVMLHLEGQEEAELEDMLDLPEVAAPLSEESLLADALAIWAGTIAGAVLGAEGVQEPVEVSLVLTSDQEIQELNRTYRGIDRPTDVLSFPQEEGEGEWVAPPNGVRNLGDIVISYRRAEEQAEEYQHSLQRELGYLIAHGVLHLLGYDHETEAERQDMRQREEHALAAAGVPPRPDIVSDEASQ